MDQNEGVLDLIGGNMFSSKTTTLLSLLFKEAIIGKNVLYVNNSKDDRTDTDFSTHNPLYKDRPKHENIEFKVVKSLYDIDNLHLYDVIGIDEGQFFANLFEEVKFIVDHLKKHVIVAALDGSFKRGKFGQFLDLIPIADSYTKLTAWCLECSKDKKRKTAPFTHRLGSGNQLEETGGIDNYIPVCRACYMKFNKIIV